MTANVKRLCDGGEIEAEKLNLLLMFNKGTNVEFCTSAPLLQNRCYAYVPTYLAGCSIGNENRKTKRKKAMENLTKKEVNFLIQLVWDGIETGEKMTKFGIASKEWVQAELFSQKILLEKLIEFEKTFKQRI